ncbi:MAG: DHH family phosphoesterase [Thermodesulfobacteriota bacterium]
MNGQWDLSRSRKKVEDLERLLKGARRDGLLILAHNNPDPDTLASCAAFQLLVKKWLGIPSTLGYGGIITRAENKAMIQRLRLPFTRLTRLPRSDYFGIAILDAQPGTGNNLMMRREEPPLVVIDHHPFRGASRKAVFRDIRPDYGATSTILTEYLVTVGIAPNRSVANALFYGIKTDTNYLLRGASQADFRAYRYLAPLTNPRVLGYIEKPRLTSAYFEAYHKGLSRATLYRDVVLCDLGPVEEESIIPVLADDLLRIEGVCWSLVTGTHQKMILMSMRSTSRKHQAGTILRRLVGATGHAGGHGEAAGGQIPLTGKNRENNSELVHGLFEDFLGLIGREGCHPRPLVFQNESVVAPS